jgi:hypothetical protein
MEQLNRLNFAASFCASQQDVRRGDEHYGQWLVTRFTQFQKKLGSNGTTITVVMTKQAKHNQYGRIEVMGYGPHNDPLRDSSSWHGLMFLHRILILGESLAYFKQDGSFDYERTYRIPTYRTCKPTATASKHNDHRIKTHTYREIWTKFFKQCNIYVMKITTQWRIQAIQEMDADGLTDSVRARMSGHKNQGQTMSTAMQQNYQTNCSVHGLASRGMAFDPLHPKTHNPPRLLVTTVVKQFAYALVGDSLLLWQRNISMLYSLCNSHKDRDDRRLITASKYIDSVVLDVENAIRLLASRPRHPSTLKLLPGDDLCYYDKYRHSTTFHELFNHPAFNSQLWVDVKDAVRKEETQSECYSVDSIITPPC